MTTAAPPRTRGIEWKRGVTDAPLDRRKVHAILFDNDGKISFEQKDVDAPAWWSDRAVTIAASKYFRGHVGQPGREDSIDGLVNRVVEKIWKWGVADGYFATPSDGGRFAADLRAILLRQMASFNSPVWFNVGVPGIDEPQVAACFLGRIEDDMESISDAVRFENRVFRNGSGTGFNFSALRGSEEPLSHGGKASGPISFMRGFDAFANIIRSGGKTRRAAKLVLLDVDHPDIRSFIHCKAEQEQKAHILTAMGYGDGKINTLDEVFFQSANHSVRVNDAFMRQVELDGDWCLIGRVEGHGKGSRLPRMIDDGKGPVLEVVKARELFREIAETAHACGDPGLVFDTALQAMHTVPLDGPILTPNPCIEFVHLVETSCNLSSLNLLKFFFQEEIDPGHFEVRFETGLFLHVAKTMFLAQEIMIDHAGYPSEAVTKRTRKYRPIGMGFTNLGALLMACGVPYASEEGRAIASFVSSLLTAQGYLTSTEVAERVHEPYFYQDDIVGILDKHWASSREIPKGYLFRNDWEILDQLWEVVNDRARKHGLVNAQATCIAPTGTISFMMDCDTTGSEPELALVKYKKCSDGSLMKLENRVLDTSLKTLGYGQNEIDQIQEWVDEHGTVEGSCLFDEHLPVFDCSLKADEGKRFLLPMDHIRMIAAITPHISGSVSKTVNLPKEITVEEIEKTYLDAWKLGLKAIAIYRDGSKAAQPLTTSKTGKTEKAEPAPVVKPEPCVKRVKLPDERRSITHKFRIGEHKGYLTVGMYDDGSPGEIFVTMAKEGSAVRGLMDTVATLTSICLQYGVPLEDLVTKFSHVRFEPQGMTRTKEIPFAHSLVDYIFRWLCVKFPERKPEITKAIVKATLPPTGEPKTPVAEAGPPCPECGAFTRRLGSCHFCDNCGTSLGCS